MYKQEKGIETTIRKLACYVKFRNKAKAAWKPTRRRETSADDLEKTWKKLGKNLEVQNAVREETDTLLQKLDSLNKIKFLILRRKEPRAKIALAKLEGRRV